MLRSIGKCRGVLKSFATNGGTTTTVANVATACFGHSTLQFSLFAVLYCCYIALSFRLIVSMQMHCIINPAVL